jgi:tetratricopeptide (TPR) repeat protein
LALHLGVSMAVLLLARRFAVARLAAAAAAGLFAVHPIHVEAVANVVGRAEIQATLFSLLALYALTHTGSWAGRAARHPRVAAWATAALLFLALGSKEVAIATPFLMVAMELLLRPRPAGGARRAWWIDRAAALAPSALAALVYVVLRVHTVEALVSLQQIHPLDNQLVELHGGTRLATALAVLAHYTRLLFIPIPLAADYSGQVVGVEFGLLGWRPLIGLFVLLVLAVVVRAPAWVDRFSDPRRRWPKPTPLGSRVAAFSAWMIVLPYLIVGNLLFSVGAILAERFMYYPSVGFCILLGLVFGALAALPGRTGIERRSIALGILALLVTAFLLLTWNRTREWRNDETVFQAAARVHPESPRAQFILGKLCVEAGEPDQAIVYLDRTIDLYPKHPSAWLEKGIALAATGDIEGAERMFRRCLELTPTYAVAHFNLALALRRQGRPNEAEPSLRKALLWDPEFAKAWAELGNLYLGLGRRAEADEAYRRGIALGRTDLRERLSDPGR